MKKNLILHLWLGKATLVCILVAFSVLLASVFSAPIAIAQSIPIFIDEDCEVFTVPRLRETYELFWDPECPSYDFIGVSQYIKFSASEESQYRIVTNSGSRFADSDSNLITLYDAAGDIVERSSPEVDGLFTFEYSSAVIANLNPGTYYVEVATLEEELSHPVPFEFSITYTDGNRLTGITLDDAFRPIQGAVGVTSPDAECTLGFAVTARLAAEDIKGVVTNSHCTNVRGELDDTQLTQGGELITKVWGERTDPNLLNRNSPDSAFNSPLDRLDCSTNCQYSDAALFELMEGFDVSYSITRLKVINTNAPQWMVDNDRSLDPSIEHLKVDQSHPSFEIVGIGRAEVGDTVHKIGLATGWTTGKVTDVCMPTSQPVEWPGDIAVDLLCQDTFEHTEGNVVGGNGDSGSPVFKCVTASGRDDPGCQNSQHAILVGIFHSSTDDACFDDVCYSTDGTFSSVDNVLREFNKNFEDEDVCWILTSSGNCYSPTTATSSYANCEVFTVPRLRESYELFWNPECQSYEWEDRYAQFIKFTVSQQSQYRITVNRATFFSFFSDIFKVSDHNLITLYDATGDIVMESATENEDGTYNFAYSSEIITILDPGTYYVNVVALDEELSFPASFEFAVSTETNGGDCFGGTGFALSNLLLIIVPALVVVGIRINALIHLPGTSTAS